MMEKIKVKRLRERAVIPTYGSAEAAGADLYACLEGKITIAPGETAFVPTGIAMEIPTGCAGLVFARSSLGTKRGLAPANKVGVIEHITAVRLYYRNARMCRTALNSYVTDRNARYVRYKISFSVFSFAYRYVKLFI